MKRFEKLGHAAVLAGRSNANAEAPRIGTHPLFKPRPHRFEPGDVGADVVAEDGVKVRAAPAQGLLRDVFDKGAASLFAVAFGHQEGAETDAGIAAAKPTVGLVNEEDVGAVFQRGDRGDDPREARADDEHVGIRFLFGFPRSPCAGGKSRDETAERGGRENCASGKSGHDGRP